MADNNQLHKATNLKLYTFIPHDILNEIETRSIDHSAQHVLDDDGNGDVLLKYLKFIHPGLDFLVSPIRRAANNTLNLNDTGVYLYQLAGGSDANPPNIRATSLAMACGLHNKRFFGGKGPMSY